GGSRGDRLAGGQSGVECGELAFHPFLRRQSKTFFAFFVYKSIIRFVRVPDPSVNKTRQYLTAPAR
ncbi:hypothetical protein, partial [Pseudomonas sp. K2]|uniref:hypothetical protein n=1 Tax=Pseudomonas sp. K2 TaxID=212119 RepID=UPI001D02F503